MASGFGRPWLRGFHVLACATILAAMCAYPTAPHRSWAAGHPWPIVAYAAAGVVTLVFYTIVLRTGPGYVRRGAVSRRAATTLIDALTPGNERFDVELNPLLGAMEGQEEAVPKEDSYGRRFCRVCRVIQPLRSKHCLTCKRCVHRYDHHCPYLGACIGEANHRWFLCFLATSAPLADYSVLALWSSFLDDPDDMQWIYRNLLAIVGMGLALIAGMVLTVLLGCHVVLLSSNTTTWEFASRERISYLKDMGPETNPFDRGAWRNCCGELAAPLRFRPIVWEERLGRPGPESLDEEGWVTSDVPSEGEVALDMPG